MLQGKLPLATEAARDTATCLPLLRYYENIFVLRRKPMSYGKHTYTSSTTESFITKKISLSSKKKNSCSEIWDVADVLLTALLLTLTFYSFLLVSCDPPPFSLLFTLWSFNKRENVALIRLFVRTSPSAAHVYSCCPLGEGVKGGWLNSNLTSIII